MTPTLLGSEDLGGQALDAASGEWFVVSEMLRNPGSIPEIVGTQLQSADFTKADAKLVFDEACELFYRDHPIDPVLIAEKLRMRLAAVWGVGEEQVPGRLLATIERLDFAGSALEHCHQVRSRSVRRQLRVVCSEAMKGLADEQLTPEEVADRMSTAALRVTSGAQRRSEIMDWMEVGREYVRKLRMLREARARGVEIGVHTGLGPIDDYTLGILPGELMILGGESGAGKTMLAWLAAEGFATKEFAKPPDGRMGTLVLSLEMHLEASTGRIVESLTGIDGLRLRQGDISDREYTHVLREWKNREGMPIYHNFASNFRLSQMRALIVEAIRRHNVGLVIIDHFRQIDPDGKVDDQLLADEVKVRFLKEDLARDLNIAVICLAHTIKLGRQVTDRRPKASDLRGSGQMKAHADFLAFLYRPGQGMDATQMMEEGIEPSYAELVWAKNRFGTEGVAPFKLDVTNKKISKI